MRMGLPRVLLSDNGSEFCNELNDQLAEMLGIKRRLTTPYHPQVCFVNVFMLIGCVTGYSGYSDINIYCYFKNITA